MRNIQYKHLVVAFTLVLSLCVKVNASPTLSVTDEVIKASIPGSDITAAYMTIHNDSEQAISLQKITSPLSDRIEIHQHSMENGMMRMRQIQSLTIKNKSQVVLAPHGLHLMIFGLKKAITSSDTVPLTLYFSNNTHVKLQLPVAAYNK